MVCHMVEIENNLGRSLVIDLTAKTENKFRQIDHRSIDFIIHRNTKYILKKGAKAVELDQKVDKNAPKWDKNSLAVDNWFSGTRYFQAVSQKGDEVVCKSQGQQITISKDILEYEMKNANIFKDEESISMTKVAAKLMEANSTAFTVCFTCKVKDDKVKEKLSTLNVKDLQKDAEAKAVAKELLTGRETKIIGRLANSEGKMGRSLVIDLTTGSYAQVDHRTLKYLIIDNTKYTVKK